MKPQDIRQLLNRYQIAPTKKKGQNFLIDEKYIEVMVEASNLKQDDVIVEIGPGLGVLTRALAAKGGQILAIELDKKLASYVRASVLKEFPNVSLIEGDALSGTTFHKMVEWLYQLQNPNASVDPKDDSYKEVIESIDKSYKLIANLPYQITSRILKQFFHSLPRPSQLTVMLQKEVAERITAKPGQMSLLALSAQTAGRIRIIEKKVPAAAFYPAPEVDSAIISCDLTKEDESYEALTAEERKFFWKLARAGYSSKRKQLKNNIQTVLKTITDEELMDVFSSAGLKPTSRAQELSVKDWCELVRLLI